MVLARYPRPLIRFRHILKDLCEISRSPNCAPNIANAGQGIAKVLTDAKVLPSQTFALVFHYDRFECEQAVRHILFDSFFRGSSVQKTISTWTIPKERTMMPMFQRYLLAVLSTETHGNTREHRQNCSQEQEQDQGR
ncbi:hypothetical protein FOVSG1_014308 [Fusarium oxysporum f. sp. vasinfectum]